MLIYRCNLDATKSKQVRFIVKGVLDMALYDWNRDGKNDCADNFIEYQVYKDCTSKDSFNSSTSPDWWIMVGLAIIMGVCPPLGAIIVLGIVIFW